MSCWQSHVVVFAGEEGEDISCSSFVSGMTFSSSVVILLGWLFVLLVLVDPRLQRRVAAVDWRPSTIVFVVGASHVGTDGNSAAAAAATDDDDD